MTEYFHFEAMDSGNAHQAAADKETRSIMCLLTEVHNITCKLLVTTIRPLFGQASTSDYQFSERKEN